MVGGAWRVAVYGVAQSWTQLKRLSSSSSSSSRLYANVLPVEHGFFFFLVSPKCVEYFISLGYGIIALQQGINYCLHKSVSSMPVINQHNGMHF